ncbi:hypothetical protein [Leptolyngbya ohadii]|uniref:hypothetical protein n=1 Tax=Leptolyngbya ohadii TaxID=1962290 RepID=UPI00117B44FF|nr:hypothetical protein [Leptolyngbya ohadii]
MQAVVWQSPNRSRVMQRIRNLSNSLFDNLNGTQLSGQQLVCYPASGRTSKNHPPIHPSTHPPIYPSTHPYPTSG